VEKQLDTRKEVSSKVGMSRGNYTKARKVYQEAPEKGGKKGTVIKKS